jgi:vacuolar-type H+-ATPase subunit H
VEAAGIRTVIQQVLDVEGQAREVVSQAEKQARKILTRAEEEAERLVESAKRDAVERVHKETAQTIEAAEKQRDARVAQEMKNDALVIERSKLKVSQAAERVVQELLGR